MTDLERQVADAFRQRAGDVPVPVPHVDRLVEDGEAALTRRRRRSGLLVVAVAAATVAALTLGTTLLGGGGADEPATPGPTPTLVPTPDPGNRSLDDLPQGRLPAVPYLYGGALHVDGLVVATPGNQVLAASDTVLVGESGERRARWWVLVDRGLRAVPVLDDVFGPRLSPRGDLLTWTSYPDARTTRVNAWDPTTRREVDHVDLDAAYAECCGGGQTIELLGVDRDDAVYWTDARDAPDVHVWRPGKGAPARVAVPADALGLLPTPPPAAFDSLPEGTKQNGIVYESGHVVLVEAFLDPRRHYVLRCSTADDRCERTLPPGRASSWVFPEPTLP